MQRVTEKKNSQSLLQVEKQNNGDHSEAFSAVSNVYLEVLENKDRYVKKNLQDCRLESHLHRQTNDKVDFSQENMDFAASGHAVREPLTTIKTSDIKGQNYPAVTDSPTLSTTNANKVLQFSSDNSDIEAEDDLIRSSQGDEDSDRKWYVIS